MYNYSQVYCETHIVKGVPFITEYPKSLVPSDANERPPRKKWPPRTSWFHERPRVLQCNIHLENDPATS